jgi:hypothetical protein
MTDLQAALGLHHFRDSTPGSNAVPSCGTDMTNTRAACRSSFQRPAPSTRHARHLYQVLVQPGLDRDKAAGRPDSS